MKVVPHVNFVNAYGLTETSSTISVLTPDDHRDGIAGDDPVVRARLDLSGVPSRLRLRFAASAIPKVRPRRASGARSGCGASRSPASTWAHMLTDDGWFPTQDAGWLDATASCTSTAAWTT